MSSAKIIDRIRKLFRLAQSDNPGEAANALARAQALMAKYRIERAQLEEPDAEEVGLWDAEPLECARSIPAWRQAVGGAIAEVNDCLCLVSETRVVEGDRHIMVIAGRRSDFDAVAAMYRWIVGEIERLATEASKRQASRNGALRMGRRWLHSFRTGAAAQVEERIYREHRTQRRKLAGDPKTATALDVRRDVVHKWADENIRQLDPGAAKGPQLDPGAFELGALAGRFMPLREDGSGAD